MTAPANGPVNGPVDGVQQWSDIARVIDLTIPEEHKLPVAVVGAGAIVEFAHLPAYRMAGIEVVGIFDLDTERAQRVADAFDVLTVYASLEDLLADERVGVVDIAVVADAQPDIADAAIDAGKHLICQKPFVRDLARGLELLARADAAGIKIAVNQQLRYDEGIAAAREIVAAGWIGRATTMTFNVDIRTDWSAWPWLQTSERLEINFHSIHYLDAIRSILGDPTTVFNTAGRREGQEVIGETRTMSTLVFPGGVNALLHVNHENLGGDYRAEFRIDGDQGSIRGILGLLYDYPHGRPDTLEVYSDVLPTDGWLSYPVTRRWLPDAFAGPLGGLLRWIATGERALTAADDNLRTLALVEALYASMDSRAAATVHDPLLEDPGASR